MRKPCLFLTLVALAALSGLLLNAIDGTQGTVQPALSPTALTASASSLAPEQDSSPQTATLTYEVHHLPQSIVYVLSVPTSAFRVTPALDAGVDTLESFAESNGAIAAVNGGFFDPVNQKTTSYVVLEGEIAADPAENERLVNNPDLVPYLDRILDRSEFRQYQCGQTLRYEIASHRAPVPADCQLLSALGAGPQLLPELALEAEGFVDIVDGERVRDALGSLQPNARTAVGITENGDVILVVAAQLPEMPTNSGMSLPELAAFMQTIGVKAALNLDGGSSSALYYQGQTHYGKVDAEGNRIERPVKSVLLVQNLADSVRRSAP